MDGTILQHLEILEKSLGVRIGPVTQARHYETKIREFQTQEQSLRRLLRLETVELVEYVDIKKARLEAISMMLENAVAGRKETERQRDEDVKREGKSPQTATSVDSPTIEGSSNPST